MASSAFADISRTHWPPSGLVAFTASFVGFHAVHALAVAGCGRGNHRAPLYVTSAVHALVVSVGALALIAQHGILQAHTRDAFGPGADPHLTHAGAVDSRVGIVLTAISFAYFAYDALATLPDWRSHPLEVVHHAIGLALTGGCCLGGVVPVRVGHHVLVTELSTPFLDAMWALRLRGRDGTTAYTVASLAFAAAFFVTRIVYLPWVTYVVLCPLRGTVLSVVPAAGPVLLALVGLNCWWWVRIARMIARGGRRAERPPPLARGLGGAPAAPDKLD